MPLLPVLAVWSMAIARAVWLSSSASVVAITLEGRLVRVSVMSSVLKGTADGGDAPVERSIRERAALLVSCGGSGGADGAGGASSRMYELRPGSCLICTTSFLR